jgi:protein involved in polysaccharide export with SLBB domain
MRARRRSADSAGRRVRRCLALLTALVLSACAVPPSPPATIAVGQSAPVIADSAYLVQAGDELELRFDDNPELNRTVKVAPDGQINLPFIGPLQASGRSAAQLQHEAHLRYAALALPGQARRYVLHAGDDIEIKFAYAPALNETLKVRPDGMVQLQLVGAVAVAGLTSEEVKDVLQSRYASYVRKPELAVILRKAVSQNVLVGEHSVRADADTMRPDIVVRSAVTTQVFIGGEVARPGALAYRPGMTVLQAMLEAGGKLPTAELRNVKVLRKGDSGLIVIERNMHDLLAQDMLLAASDVVLVPQTRVATTAEMLNEYVFKLLPFVRNSTFSYVYDLRKNP